jgi:hypothetical protein
MVVDIVISLRVIAPSVGGAIIPYMYKETMLLEEQEPGLVNIDAVYLSQ